MPQFLLTYVGGSQPATPEEGEAHRARYMDWIAGLGSAAIVPQQPLKATEMLGDASVTSPIMGYSIIAAADAEAARAIARSCPFLEMDKAAMQVSELMAMG